MSISLFRDVFLKAVDNHPLTLNEICRNAGVSVDQFKKLREREGQRVKVEDAIKIANFFGMTLSEFIGESHPISDPQIAELVSLWSKITPEARQILLAGAQASADHNSGPEK